MIRRRIGLFVVAVAAGGAAFWFYRFRSDRRAPTEVSPEWPAFSAPQAASALASDETRTSARPADETQAPSSAPAPGEGAAFDPSRRWIEPADGACPSSHPIKGNSNSGIFHVPSGRFYARTVPERCYATAEDAAADGFRPSKA
jgi:hypothetical protein